MTSSIHSDSPTAVAAQEYAQLGTRVFPCHSDSKAPRTRGGFKAATTDPALIRRWWHAWPDALIGVPTGAGLVVIDVDPRSGGTVDPNWPATLTATTRSGGIHRYYAGHDVPSSVGRFAPGVDVRADGGYVIAPPSPGWVWDDPAAPIVELPAWMAERARSVRSVGAARGGGFQPAERVGEGGRNTYMAAYVGWLLHGLDDPDEDELGEMAQQHNVEVCRPPLPADEVDQVVRSIVRTHLARTAA